MGGTSPLDANEPVFDAADPLRDPERFAVQVTQRLTQHLGLAGEASGLIWSRSSETNRSYSGSSRLRYSTRVSYTTELDWGKITLTRDTNQYGAVMHSITVSSGGETLGRTERGAAELFAAVEATYQAQLKAAARGILAELGGG